MLRKPFLRPWQGFRKFIVKTPANGLSASGRPITNGWADKGVIIAALTNATPREIEQAKQSGHPITHKVVQESVNFEAEPKDRLVLENGENKRIFLIQNLRNPASLDHCVVYYCEERADLND